MTHTYIKTDIVVFPKLHWHKRIHSHYKWKSRFKGINKTGFITYRVARRRHCQWSSAQSPSQWSIANLRNDIKIPKSPSTLQILARNNKISTWTALFGTQIIDCTSQRTALFSGGTAFADTDIIWLHWTLHTNWYDWLPLNEANFIVWYFIVTAISCQSCIYIHAQFTFVCFHCD